MIGNKDDTTTRSTFRAAAPDPATAALYGELDEVWGAAAAAYRRSDIATVTGLIVPRDAPAPGVFARVQHLALIGAGKCADELTRLNGRAPGGPLTVLYAPNPAGWAVFGDCPRSRRAAAQCLAAAGNGQYTTVVDLLIVHLRPGAPRSHTQVAVFLLDAYVRLTAQPAVPARPVTRQAAAVS